LELSWLAMSASEAIGVVLPSGEKRVGRFLRFGKVGRKAGDAFDDGIGLVSVSLLLQGTRQQEVADIGGLYSHGVGILTNGLGQIAVLLGKQAKSDHCFRGLGCIGGQL
jgi:hypothetical protein